MNTKYTPNLLTNQSGIPNVPLVRPLAEKQLTQERIQRLLLTAQLLAARTILLMERAEEPFQHEQGPSFRVVLVGGRD